ncbi:PKD domain-containing protein [Methanosarcina acetivorans]|uniref:Cell surface protein n=1 Tax=Methanosarcina acetivorans (strain ATCC 35395 / DSM 2834 / JCM 12185 / C2A) TaxID=188937 RepID=Q8TI69_METAC|nr:PQQ-binding-like beta-propeller repeat protein [Methanosarcina acetivorans]AAM07631.1 cell surface protein [Methanosarcina acetivorans C2A]
MNKHTLKIFLICVILFLVAAAQPVLGSDWAQFQKDIHNTGVTADRAPITDPTNCSLSWNYSMGGNIDVTPVVAGDMTYVVASNNHLCAFNRTTGTLLWEESTSGGGFLLGNLAVGNGIVFVPTVDGKIFAFDAETGSPKWNKTLSSKQLDTPILYYDGKIYFGEAMGGRKYYCLDETGNEVWNRTATTQNSGQGSYYWAGAAVIGDSLVYGDDDGHLVSVNKDTGTDIAEIDVSEEFGITCKEIRSSVLYVEELNRIYFTSKGGYCYALGFNVEDGTFNTSEKYIANIGYSTSTPAYYNGRVYVGAGGMYGGGSGISCLDENLTDEIWHYAAGAVQSSPAISTYYDDGDGEAYIYFTVNSATGGVFCLKDYTGCTNPELAWSYADASKTAYTLAGAVISDGWIYYGTDKRYLFGFTTEKEQTPSIPVANFSANPLSGDSPLTVQFTDLSTGDGINVWAWDFNNDGIVDSTEQNPSHTYTPAGNYTVNLTVENANGSDFEVKTDHITVTDGSSGGDAPVADFTANVTSGVAPLTINFTDQSTNAESWAWDFNGDGIVDSTEQNPQYTYYPGNYTVNLAVNNSAGSDTESKEDYIWVIGPYSTAVANENPGAPDPGIPQYIGPDGDGKHDATNYPNNYKNPIFVASYTSIVDYSPSTGREQNSYRSLGDLYQEEIDAGASPGEITVWFEAPICNGEGADFAAYENGFIISDTNLIFAELGYLEVSTDGEHFVRFPSVSYTPEAVGGYGGVDARNVYNLVGKHVHMYGDYWGTPFNLDDLADDPGVLNGSVDLNEINYVKIVDIPGTGYYKDSLGNPIYDAWPTYGTGGLEFGGVDIIHCRPAANFTADETTGSGSLTVQFNDTSTGGPTSWFWDFGDGNTSTEQNPVHEYTTNGTYTVSLKAINEFGNDSEVREGYITVEYKDPRSPVVDFTADPVSGAFPLTVNFTDASTGNPTGWFWDFGDGNTSTEQNPVHVYADSGKYTVKLTATNEFGSSYLVKTDYIEPYGILADTPWPKFRMDARNSGISPYTGPQTNNTIWNITTDASFSSSSSFSIGSDGTIYFGGGYSDYNVYALNPDGTLKWNYTVGKSIYGTPTISSDGTIYFGSSDKNCYALNPDGTLKWSYTTDSTLAASPAIGSDGTIYFGGQSGHGTDGTVYAMNPDGTLKWSYTDSDAAIASVSPAIGSDETIYVPFQDGTVYALNPDGTEKWNFSTGSQIYSSAVLDSEDVLYIGTRGAKVFAINPDGTEKWNYTAGGSLSFFYMFDYSSPIVGTDGTVYIGTYGWNDFFALNPNGTLKWSSSDIGSSFSGSPVMGADGTIYIGSNDKKVSAINPNGTIKWTYTTEASVGCTPAIGSDGTLYIGTDTVYDTHGDFLAGGVLYAFRDPADLPVASFTSDTTSDEVPLSVSFTDTSERAESWAWDFDSDGVVDSTEQSPTYTYISPGNYTVTLTVSNTGGSDAVIKEDYINVLEAPASSSADEDTWYQFRKTAEHTGYTTSDAPDTNTLLWRSARLTDDFTLVPSSSVAIADGKVFANAIIGSVDEEGNPEEGAIGQLVAFSMYNGRKYWNTTIAVPEWGSWSSPAYDNGFVFTSTGANTTCINATTGAIEWTFTNPSGRASCNGGPVIAEGKVLCSDWDGLHYYCLDETTGTELWNYTVDSSDSYTQGTPAVSNGTIILTSWDDIYCLDMDGNLLWAKPNPSSSGSICGSPSIAGDMFYLTTYDFGSDDKPALFAFDLENGTEIWNATIQRTDSTPAIADGYLYVCGGCTGYSESQTYCFDALNGTLIWSTPKADQGIGDWTCSIAVADGKVFVGKSAGSSFGHKGLYALNAETGDEIWYSDSAGDSPAIADDTVFSIGLDQEDVAYLYAFKDEESGMPVADFSADITSGVTPLTVNFTDQSTGTPTSWFWEFGDGGNSTEQNPSHIYNAPGTYTVNLTVENAGGTDFELKSDYIEVSEASGSTVTLYFDPESASVAENESTEINLVASNFPAGLSGYNLTVALDDPDVAEIVDIEYPTWALITENSSLPATSIYMKTVDLEDAIQEGAADVVLATLTVSGKEKGSANLSIGVKRLEEDSGDSIEPALLAGTIEVTLLSPLPDQEYAPKDLNGDGLYEDLTGNGEFSFVDIVAYFHNMDWIEENMPVEYFDFNGNGRIDFDDVVDMFAMI